MLTAGFPCQDISAAGRRAGIENGARSGLWTDIMAAVRLLRPALLVVENVAALRWKNGGLHRVLGDLAATGYDALWHSLRASDIGAAHRRERVFLLAWPRHAADADRTRRLVQRHQCTEPSRRPHAARPATTPTDPAGLGHRHRWAPSGRGIPPAAVAAGASIGRPEGVAANTEGDGRDNGLPSTTWLEGRPHAAVGGHAPAGRAVASTVDWGPYTAAVHRWEQALGRPAPHPTETGQHGGPVLSPKFVEWLQGLPPGWITDLPLPRTAQLRALGNGVVPQQAAHAVTLLLNDLVAFLDAERGHGTAAA